MTRVWQSSSNDLKLQFTTKSRTRRTQLAARDAAGTLSVSIRNDVLPILQVVELPLAILRAPSREIRKCDPVHVAEVAKSVSTLGFCVPVLVGADNLVLDGWIRVEAAKALGLDRVPCVQIDHLNTVEQR